LPRWSPRPGKDPPPGDTNLDMQTRTTPEAPLDEVVLWRRAQLMDAGFSAPLAAETASDPRFDLHVLIELVEHGCPPDLAVRILAPLEDEGVA
jgi:hypothetical protein